MALVSAPVPRLPLPPLISQASLPAAPGPLDRARGILGRHALHPASREALTVAAVNGMLRAVHDPYGRYLTDRDFERLLTEAEGMYVGIGVEIRVADGRIVLDPVAGGPAARAGLQRGSVLQAVNGAPVRPVTAEAAQIALDGPPGTSVWVSVLERGRPRVYALTRGEVRVEPVRSRRIPGGLGYLRIQEFSRGSGHEAAQAAQRLAATRVSGLVVDLRGNPGGFLDEALTFLDAVAHRGVMAHIDYRDREDLVETASGPGLSIPVVVLVDRDTASAAELVASSLRERNAAAVVGQRTYGKAYLQELVGLGPEGGLAYTVARVEDARGRSWQGRGLEPDVFAGRESALGTAARLLRTRPRPEMPIPGL